MSKVIDKTTQYAKLVSAGRITAGKLVRLACMRHLDDLKRANAKVTHMNSKQSLQT